MVQYKIRKLAGGSTQISIILFNIVIWACLRANKSGWFRLFGFGITWTHKSIKPMFSERIGKRKKIEIGNYRYGFLNYTRKSIKPAKKC